MYIKVIDDSTATPVETLLDENYLSQCAYRKDGTGKTVLSIAKTFDSTTTSLESHVTPWFSLASVKVELYSGTALLRTLRGVANSYNLTDVSGAIVERVEFHVGTENVVQPVVKAVSYNVTSGILKVQVDHFNHADTGFTAADIDITKVHVNGNHIAAADATITIISHTEIDVTIAGASKTNIDATIDVAGSANSAGTPYEFSVHAGWNLTKSTDQKTGLSATL